MVSVCKMLVLLLLCWTIRSDTSQFNECVSDDVSVLGDNHPVGNFTLYFDRRGVCGPMWLPQGEMNDYLHQFGFYYIWTMKEEYVYSDLNGICAHEMSFSIPIVAIGHENVHQRLAVIFTMLTKKLKQKLGAGFYEHICIKKETFLV